MSLKKLAGQTMWYGLSSIFARFLNYLLTPYLTAHLIAADYGEMSLVYAYIPFLNVLFTYGMETAFFRFSNKEEDPKNVFNTISSSILLSTGLLTAALLLSRDVLADLFRLTEHPEFITWAAWIIALDTLTTIPYAKLRNDGRPAKYASIRILGILINIGLVFFFYSLLPGLAQHQPDSLWAEMYDPHLGAGYVIIANLAQSALTFLLLAPEFFSARFSINKKLWTQLIVYSLPIMIAGFAGMINETFDRIMLNWLAPVGSETAAKEQVGIYSACYKLSILITLFIQAFRMGAEPFFFKQAAGEDAPKTYARVMNYFVITICVMFLVVTLYLDLWKEFIRNREMWTGLKIVPVLLIANMCLGVYYNLSIWYKLSHKTSAGAIITLIGAAVTLLINFLFIPTFGYVACAWATLACYGSMMLISYLWGQKVYPVPYQIKRLLGYFGVMLLVYAGYTFIADRLEHTIWRLVAGTFFLLLYLIFIGKQERENLRRIPVIRRLV